MLGGILMNILFKRTKQSLKELKELENKNKFLKNEILNYEDLEKFEERNIFCNKHSYSELYFKRLPLSFIDTSFYFYSYDLYPHVNCTFEYFLMENSFEELHLNSMKSIVLSFAMLCIGVEPTKEGPVLILVEPFMTLHTKPLSKTSLKLAKSWVNRILIVDLTLTSNSFNKKEFEVNRIKSLKITKNGKIDLNGKENIFKWGDNMRRMPLYDDEYLANVRCDKGDLVAYKNCTGKDECIEALDRLEETYFEKCFIPPFRQNKTTLWIRFKYEAMGIFYYNNRLEIIYEPKDDVNYLYKPDGSFDAFKWPDLYFFDFCNNKTKFYTTEEKNKIIKEEECMVTSYRDLLQIYKIK